MCQFFWEIDPWIISRRYFLLSDTQENEILRRNAKVLCKEYEKTKREIQQTISDINGKEFFSKISQFYLQEAYLAELYNYLTNPVLLSMETSGERLLKVIDQEYLLDYMDSIDYTKTNTKVKTLVGKLLYDKYRNVYENRFGKQKNK